MTAPAASWNHNAAFHPWLVADELLPGARLRRRFHCRYSLTWDRPEEES